MIIGTLKYEACNKKHSRNNLVSISGLIHSIIIVSVTKYFPAFLLVVKILTMLY